MSKELSSMRNFDFLDAYRGLAALTVVCQHAGEYTGKRSVFNGGWFGVPAFFQLSAFLLTYRMILQYDNSRQHGLVKQMSVTCKYFIMRFCRIYLTYLIFCVLELFSEHFIVGVRHGYSLPNRITFMILLRTDIMTDEPVGSLWTLPVEIIYYFFIPVLAYAMSHMRKTWHVLVMLVATVYFVFFYMRAPVRRFTSQSVRQDVWHNFVDHWPIFFLGSLIAFFYIRVAEERNITLDKYPNISAGVGWFAFFAQYVSWRLPVLYLFYPSIQAMLSFYDNCILTALHLALIVFAAPNVFTQWLSKCKVLRNFGKWSFGTYMLHVSVLLFLGEKNYTMGLHADDLFVLMVLTSFAVGYVFHELVEKHTIRFAHYINNRLFAPIIAYEILPIVTLNEVS